MGKKILVHKESEYQTIQSPNIYHGYHEYIYICMYIIKYINVLLENHTKENTRFFQPKKQLSVLY